MEEKESNGEYLASFVEKGQDEAEQSKVYLMDFDDDFLLNCERDSDNEEMEEENQIKLTAKLYLEQDDRENLDRALEDSKKIDSLDSAETWHHAFFNFGIKDIRQPSLISRDLSVSQKESHISELSASICCLFNKIRYIYLHLFIASRGRAYLLQTGCIKDWFHSGWKCPNYIYQWLFEVGRKEIVLCYNYEI